MKKHFWEKQLSVLFAGTVLCGMLAVMPTSAADQPSLLILGDSISSGDGLAAGECGYYDYVAECTGASLTNLAKSGSSTEDLLNLIDDTANQDAIKKADIISISIGGNDLMQPTREYFDSLKQDGESIIQTLKRVAKEGDPVKLMGNLTAKLRAPRQAAIANIPVIEEKLRALNPDAKIVMQTLYNPFEVKQSYLDERGFSASDIKNYNTFMTYVNNNEKQINNAIAALETVQSAEVGAAFKSDSLIYDRVLQNDPHPTALGHALIAAVILDTIGDVSGKSAKLKATVDGLDQTVAAQISAEDKALIEKYMSDQLPAETTTAAATTTTTTAATTITTTTQVTTTVTTTTTTPVTTTTTTTTTPATTTTTTTTTVTTTQTTTTTTRTTTAATTTTPATTSTESTTVTTTTSQPVTSTTPAEPEFLRGDISGDGKVGVDDAQAALIAYTEQFAGNPVDLTAAQRKAVDVNEDGVLSVEDAQYILIFYTENNVAGKNVSWNEIIPKK